MEKRVTRPETRLFFPVVLFLAYTFFSAQGAAADQMPDSLILLPENGNAVLVEKTTQTLFFYSRGPEGVVNERRFPCSTGEASGIKFKEGDKKTPEGVYFFKDKYEDRDLTPVYGKKALPTDYPNFIDRRAGRNGSQIWLHGTNRVLKPMDTNGCVSMNNDDIVALARWIAINSTPLVIVEEIQWRDRSAIEREKREIVDWLEEWIASLEHMSYHAYLDFYDNSYLPPIRWWRQWQKLRDTARDTFEDPIRVVTDNRGIYRYDGVLVVFFDMGLQLGGDTLFFGKRKVFVSRKGPSERYKIIGDVFQYINSGFETHGAPIVAAASGLVSKTDRPLPARKMVKQWLKAWSDEDIETYAAFYSGRFFSDGMSKSEWISRKRRLARKYRYIKVTGRDFTFSKEGDKIGVSFYQNYESSGFSAQGIKKLLLIKEDGSWKIYRESWQEK